MSQKKQPKGMLLNCPNRRNIDQIIRTTKLDIRSKHNIAICYDNMIHKKHDFRFV
jgi:hypothetical protein